MSAPNTGPERFGKKGRRLSRHVGRAVRCSPAISCFTLMKLFRDCRCGSSLSIKGDITGEADIPIFCNDSDNSNGHRDVVHSEITVSMCSMSSILDFKHKKSLLRSLGSPMVELSDFHSSLLWHSIDIHCSSISARKFLSGPRTTRGVLLGRHLYIPDGAVFVLPGFVLSGIFKTNHALRSYNHQSMFLKWM